MIKSGQFVTCIDPVYNTSKQNPSKSLRKCYLTRGKEYYVSAITDRGVRYVRLVNDNNMLQFYREWRFEPNE